MLRKCSAIIYAPSEHKLPTQGSRHLPIIPRNHEPIFFQFTQKNKPNYRVDKFQHIVKNSPRLHTAWTEGKNLALSDLLSRSVTSAKLDEKYFKTIKVTEMIKICMTHNQALFHLACHYSVSKNIYTRFTIVFCICEKQTI